MREILFRGKRKDKGEWVEGGLDTDWGLPATERDRYWIDRPYLGKISVIPGTVGQYTGLTDKNGTKIFEGDIVDVVGEIGQEIVEEDKHRFAVKWQEDCGFNLLCWFEYVVIGNIHDNHELLKGGATVNDEQRERLAELLYKINDTICSDLLSYEREEVADYLLKNGVVVLPCKVGDVVYLISDGKCKEIEIENIHQYVSGQWKFDGWYGKGKYREGYEIGIDNFGKTVFFTREEAEKALERSRTE